MGNTGPVQKGGYFRGFLAAAAVSSVSFIAISTAFPSNPFPTVNPNATPAQQTALIVEPAVNRLVPLDQGGANQTTLGLQSNLQSPSLSLPTAEAASGLQMASNDTAMPSVPSASLPTSLSADTGSDVTIANTETAGRPTAGFEVQTASIAQPMTDSSQVNLQPTVNVAAVATTELPPIPQSAANGLFATNAQAFNDTGLRPLVSLVLMVETIDQVRDAFGLTASVTIAIDATNPNAAELAAAYRKVDGESLLILPNGAATSGIDQYIAGGIPVIGVLDIDGGALSNDPANVNAALRALSPLGGAIVAPTGHNALLVAAEANIPAVALGGQISGGDTPSIIASMNSALVNVSPQNPALVFGRADDTTITALYNWLAGSAASKVTMAPVSAAIQRQ